MSKNHTQMENTIKPLQVGPPCCDPKPVINVQGLQVQYGNQTVLRNVSLTLYRGCVTALIGPSGCGKTTFLSCLNRLTDMYSQCHVDGRIEFEGQDILSPNINPVTLRKRVGMIFQKPNPFPVSIRKNLELPLKEHGIVDRANRQRLIRESLQQVGLWEEVNQRLDASALDLSGGQQQRLCIARALILKPDVLLMDEPCSALDPLSTKTVESLIQGFRGQFTTVIVTHNLAQAKRIADYVAFFWSQDGTGRLVEHGTGSEMFEQPQDELTRAYVSGLAG